MLAEAEEGFHSARVGFCGLPAPTPAWKSPVPGHRLSVRKELTDLSGAGWSKLSRSPMRFNSTTPGLEYEAE